MLDRGDRPFIRLRGRPDRRVIDAAARLADRFDLNVTFGIPSEDNVLLTVDHRRTGAPEGYRLQCNAEGISLQGRSAGLFYGLETVSRILQQCDQWIPHVYIEDRPDFAHRGVMLDISRCKVPTLATLYSLIDRLAALKYNQIQLYTEHTFAFSGHERVWADASPLTAADITRIHEYCRQHFIELVPNLNSFGHFERWLRHPEYHRYAECPDGFTHPLSGEPIEIGSTLKPNRNSLNLLKSLYDELLPLFDATAFNVGGDEPWDLGQGWSRRRCEEVGATRVYIEFLRRDPGTGGSPRAHDDVLERHRAQGTIVPRRAFRGCDRDELGL
ncbi:MAG: family 20 glycosylhydrolase [Gammaproteobacteria bacterium]|nr:family 20 glycosylhydrolase [Gammaproteobacteria bacterium]